MVKLFAALSLFALACGPTPEIGSTCVNINHDAYGVTYCNPQNFAPELFWVQAPIGEVHFVRCDCSNVRKPRVEFSKGPPLPSLPDECYAIVPSAYLPEACAVGRTSTALYHLCQEELTMEHGLVACWDQPPS